MTGRSQATTDAREYQEAISQWQLAARTEVKKFSSLPSAMFDTCDPMLEACLADSVEKMMHRLHEPEPTTLAQHSQHQEIEIRVEKVSPQELWQLRSVQTEVGQKLDLDANIASEYLSILIDGCSTADESTQLAARQRLQLDFGIETVDDLKQATDSVLACLQQTFDEASATELDERTDELCRTIAASIVAADKLPQEES